MAGNLEHLPLSKLAEEVLIRIESVEDSVEHLAAAGRFEPLLSHLREGSDDVKIEVAFIIGRMTLTNNCKELIARHCAQTLVELLAKPEGRTPSLQALNNLSGFDDNASILVGSAVLAALLAILLQEHGTSPEWKELAASTIANIVSNPGHWELAAIDKKGNLMQSEYVVSSVLAILLVASPQGQASILRILYGMASSPQASESVATHIKNSADGIKTIVLFLEYSEVEHRIYAFKLTRVLTERFGHDLARELKLCNKLPLFKEKLLDKQSTDSEKSDAACILANLPFSEDEVKTILGSSFVKWTVETLKKQHHIFMSCRPTSSMAEGLLGILLHFTRGLDPDIISLVKECQLMIIFRQQLSLPAEPRVKQLAAVGLKNLSEAGRSLVSADAEPLRPQGFCASLVFMCGRAPPEPSTCPIHNAPCENNTQLCLLKSNCIKPLVDLLHHADTNVQIAAIEALSTLVLDTSRAVDELEKHNVMAAVIEVFTEAHRGVLQERALWMIERVLRLDGPAHKYSLNQSLVRALVEAFKHGNAKAKRHAQDALTNLKQISGVSGKASSQSWPKRHAEDALTNLKEISGVSGKASSQSWPRSCCSCCLADLADKSKLPHPFSSMKLSCCYVPYPKLLSIWRMRKPKENLPAWSRIYRRFKLKDLLNATNNFDPAQKIAEDGSYSLYQGHINDYGKYPIAIKRFTSSTNYGCFLNEMELLFTVDHPNIISPAGYCLDESHQHMIIVYNHMAQGTLQYHLQSTNGESPLSWKRRLQVCIGAARGLEYLHSSNPLIINRDIKSKNIHLDKNWGAKIFDFSLSKSIPSNLLEYDDDHITTDIAGTIGYLDPEYAKFGKLTTKSDVYSFGVVLFEVLCGRKHMDFSLPEEQKSLTQWSRQCIEDGRLDEIIDPPLKGEIAPNCLKAYANLAYNCSNEHSNQRPTVTTVCKRL